LHVCAGMAKEGSGKVWVGSVAVTAQTAVGRNPLLLARQAIMRGGPRLTAGALHLSQERGRAGGGGRAGEKTRSMIF